MEKIVEYEYGKSPGRHWEIPDMLGIFLA